MRRGSWTRWQDWGAVVIGLLTALSPLVTANDTASLWTRVVFGVLLAAAGLWSLSQPESVASEYVHIALGVLLFLAPWVMRYSNLTWAAWTSWVAGVLAVAVGVAALPAANQPPRDSWSALIDSRSGDRREFLPVATQRPRPAD
jgi:hypothetical protein